MSFTTLSEVSVNPRIQALKERHIAISKEIDEAQKNLSTTDAFLRELKKKKLIIKEQIADEERLVASH